jgi:hypothetical protein
MPPAIEPGSVGRSGEVNMAITPRPTYPVPDRSKQKVYHVKDEDGVIDIGWCNGVMSDGRAFPC